MMILQYRPWPDPNKVSKAKGSFTPDPRRHVAVRRTALQCSAMHMENSSVKAPRRRQTEPCVRRRAVRNAPCSTVPCRAVAYL